MIDSYIDMEIELSRGLDRELYHAKVKRRAVDRNGISVVFETSNPITDIRLYDVEYLDGIIETLAANVMAENIFSQVDEEGHLQLMIDEIIDHRSNSAALLYDDALYSTNNYNTCRKRITKVWELCVQWMDVSYHWIEINDIKKF